MNLECFAECEEKQEKGSPCYLDDGVFYVKRIHTIEYHKQREQIKNRLYGFSSREFDENLITAHWLTDHGVTGWEGIYQGDDELEFNQQNAAGVFLNPSYRISLNAMLINHAGNYANYLSDEIAEDIEAIKKS